MGRKKIVGFCVNHPDRSIHTKGLCSSCYRKLHYELRERERRGATKHELQPIGTIAEAEGGYLRIKVDTGHGARDWIKHHKYVMEQKLGRKLESFENVHHVNGIKNDNRPENLELWITKQPKGQRVKDLIEYSKWILKNYNNETTIS